MSLSLPSRELLQLQANWLAPARARLLRKAEITRRKRVLGLGCGYGVITAELQRRSGGTVIALDQNLQAVSAMVAVAPAVCGDAAHLPFTARSFDLIFSQNLLLWVRNTTGVVKEGARMLESGGAWVLFEPDYGGLMEYPPAIETRDLWIQALQRAGADPFIGRKLPAILDEAEFRVDIELLPQVLTAHPSRFAFLEELPLTEPEKIKLEAIKQTSKLLDSARQLSHLPYYLMIARRS